jgi:hypothetical protein
MGDFLLWAVTGKLPTEVYRIFWMLYSMVKFKHNFFYKKWVALHFG